MLSSDWTIMQLSKLRQQQPELVDSALQQLLNENPELTWSLVIQAYLEAEMNLGKAAELLNTHELALREQFIELGIPLRQGPADEKEAKAEADAVRQWFSDTPSTP